jgi:hypothetical protein
MKSQISSKAQVIDSKFITITDFSVYNEEIPVTNALYRITIVNFNQYVDIPYTPGTVMNINTNLLKFTSVKYSSLGDVPSGLYLINQSVCPNDKLYYEYYLLNITPDLNKVADAVCCNQGDAEKLDTLWQIKMELEMAKSLAETCGDTAKATSVYNAAVKALSRLDCEC